MNKRPIDYSLEAARKRLSPQTGWIHLCYEGDGTRHDTIPLLENFFFAFALFRSRLSEDILQGKERLEKILHFEVEGAFPVYLHEFPEVRDHGLAIEILPIFHHLLQEFTSVLGESLELRLRAVIARIIAKSEAQSFTWSPGKRAKLQAVQGHFSLQPGRTIHSSQQLADELIALQMQGEISRDALQECTRFWHAGFDLYCGPYARELQEGGVPQPTLFDYFMGSRRIPLDHPIHLRTALVYPLSLQHEKRDEPYLLFEEPENKALHMFWGSPTDLHSMVFQGVTHWQRFEDNYEIEFALHEEPPKEGVEKCEVNIFLNYHPNHAFTVDQGRANSFTFEQTLAIASSPLAMELRFSVVEGEGRFYGHLLRGNRPRQVALRGEKRFSAYDWQIALRTLSRGESCTVRLNLNVRRDLCLSGEGLPLENGAIHSDSHGMEPVVDVECNTADC